MIRKIPVTLNRAQARELISMPDKNCKTGVRNKAILSLMVDSGMRVSEVINLKPGDINFKDCIVTIIGGKKNVDRFVGFGPHTETLLRQYKEVRPRAQTFFSTQYKSNFPQGKSTTGNKLNRIYLYEMIRKYAIKAGIKEKVSPHTLRHTFALDFYKNSNHDLKALQRILGHVSAQTTMIYGWMDSSDVKESLSTYYKQRDGLHYEEKDDTERIEELDKQIRSQLEEIQLLKANRQELSQA